MLSGNNRRRTQRITVGVIVGAVVLSLALSLFSAAWPAGLGQTGRRSALGASPTPSRPVAGELALAATATPAPTEEAPIGTSGAPKPVTKTPQGQATQVTDQEHIGGLIGFIAFMLGGVLLLVRGRRRNRRERTTTPILS